MKNKFEQYCTGCGLCESLGKAKLQTDERGFVHPVNYDASFLRKVCPAAGLQSERLSRQSIWGRRKAVYLGWSTNPTIREQASSGGILTTVAAYLLDEKIVDGIIHIQKDDTRAYKNQTVINTTVKEVIAGSGSRYSISHPLEMIGKLDPSKTYCLIAKPCDINAFRNYARIHPEINESIKICMSFFCMGLPSDNAQKKLLEKLKCSDGCRSLIYRGNGWPGFATAVDQKNESHSITYDESWGKILGRDLMSYCRYCIDGIGEEADIACGDAWYIKAGRPDFSEHAGRNVVFARTNLGEQVLQKAYAQKRIELERLSNNEEYLQVIQNSQYMRRATLIARVLALRMTGKPYPEYNLSPLRYYGAHISLKTRLKSFFGMIKRIHAGKI